MDKFETRIELCFAIHAEYTIIDSLAKTDLNQICKNLFSNLYRLPNVPFSFIFSGMFLEKLNKKEQSFFSVLLEMQSRKQIDILGNAFYEPFMPIIPTADLVGQIEYMADFLRKYFEKKPHGIYLPHSAWNPNIIPGLKKCGFEYCLLDKRFFESAGLNCASPVCLEDSGKVIFAIPTTLEYEKMNISPLEFYQEITKNVNKDSVSVLVVFLSPKTAASLSSKNENEKSWMEEFSDLVNKQDSLITLKTTENILNSKCIYQKGYIKPCGIFANKYVDSSIKQLIAKKRDSYSMYVKTVYVRNLINQIRGDKARKKNAFLNLWKAETGILFNLDDSLRMYGKQCRDFCYKNLLHAERYTRSASGFTNSLTSFDFDLDGIKEFISQRENLNVYVHSLGGKIFELDVFHSNKNYADTGIESAGLFIDHIVSNDDLNLIKDGNFYAALEQPVFCKNLYQDIKLDRHNFKLLLKTDGVIKKSLQNVSLRKMFEFTEQGAVVQYILKNESSSLIAVNFMVEVNVAISCDKSKIPDISVYAENKKHDINLKPHKFESVSWLQIIQPDGKITFRFEANEIFNLMLLPIYENEDDADNDFLKPVISGIRCLFYWNIKLESNYESEKMLFLLLEPQKKTK